MRSSKLRISTILFTVQSSFSDHVYIRRSEQKKFFSIQSGKSAEILLCYRFPFRLSPTYDLICSEHGARSSPTSPLDLHGSFLAAWPQVLGATVCLVKKTTIDSNYDIHCEAQILTLPIQFTKFFDQHFFQRSSLPSGT
ncbi:hypothetical protein ARMSODRAFT_400404 [Armillaria solidipes]|uniref:Uncharacterized protein n=1 Tax=Armillaria solidipes TaxID=1076256 RepID=A0A2H3CK20_9AGAR|nr:hypothetical protein ARMSODRAFT_400404 [Armillaria solidipes]